MRVILEMRIRQDRSMGKRLSAVLTKVLDMSTIPWIGMKFRPELNRTCGPHEMQSVVSDITMATRDGGPEFYVEFRTFELPAEESWLPLKKVFLENGWTVRTTRF